MKTVFAQTHNVGQFMLALEAITESHPDAPKLALVTGQPGTGRTRTAIYYAANMGGTYLRAKNVWRGNFRNFLRALVVEHGHKPAHRADLIYNQAADLLRESGRPVIIDEADYLDRHTVHTARDLHDEVGVPFVFIGVDRIAEIFVAEQVLWSRLVQTVQFQGLQRDEVPGIMAQLCEVPVSQELVDLVSAECRMMRDLVRYVLHVEKAWRGRTHEAPASVVKGFKARVLKGRAAA